MSKKLLELSEEELDLLGWFAEWTEMIHRLDWPQRRLWPPGFRRLRDMSSVFSGHPQWEKAHANGEVGPSPAKSWADAAQKLLPFGLIEGSTEGVYRLTPRGRAALKLSGRSCPDVFVAHAWDFFDDVSLLPRLKDLNWDTPGTKGVNVGDLVGDSEAVWSEMLVEYDESTTHGRHTLVGSTAALIPFRSNGTYLNGSLRVHTSGLTLRIKSGDGQGVCEVMMSHEGLADLLTAAGAVPVTLGSFTGQDGMRYSEPVPPPFDVERRMLERLAATEDKGAKSIKDACSMIDNFMRAGKLSKKNGSEVLQKLRSSLNNADANRAFVIEQAAEELSQVAEATETLMQVRAAQLKDSRASGEGDSLGLGEHSERGLAGKAAQWDVLAAVGLLDVGDEAE